MRVTVNPRWVNAPFCIKFISDPRSGDEILKNQMEQIEKESPRYGTAEDAEALRNPIHKFIAIE